MYDVFQEYPSSYTLQTIFSADDTWIPPLVAFVCLSLCSALSTIVSVLSFFIWPLHCLFFELWLLITLLPLHSFFLFVLVYFDSIRYLLVQSWINKTTISSWVDSDQKSQSADRSLELGNIFTAARTTPPLVVWDVIN